MSTLTIPRLSERIHTRLLRRAAENGRSVEAKVRAILDAAIGLSDESVPMVVHRKFSEAGDVDIGPPDRIDSPQDVTSL